MIYFVLPNMMGGGAERAALNIMRALPQGECRLVVFEEKFEYDCDVPVHVLRGNPLANGPALRRLRQAIEGTVALLALKRRSGDGTWISFTTVPNVMNALTKSKGRVVLSVQNRESGSINGRFDKVLRSLVAFGYPRADLIVAASDSTRDDLAESFGVPRNSVRTIHNSVDLEEIERLRQAPVDEHLAAVLERPTVVTVGRLIDQKGQWHLVRSFAATRRRVPDARLVVIGKGALGPYLAELARQAGLVVWADWEERPRLEMRAADVVFPGFTRNPFAVLSRATVFAFTSLWEGFGNVIIEAMACGVPAVVADCRSGPREIVWAEGGASAEPARAPEYAGAGVVMPVLDGEKRAASEPLTAAEQAWAEVLARALTDGEFRQEYTRRGRTRAEAFSTQIIGQRWKELLGLG